VLEEVALHIRPWVPVISLTKGLELSSGKRMTELVVECLPGHPVGVLTGPNLAREIHGRASGGQRHVDGGRDHRQAACSRFSIRGCFGSTPTPT
jgi:hypothetical protein